jgi:pyruvate,water dikinase
MILSKFRELIYAVGRNMVEDAFLKDIEDIFFLELSDVLDYLTGKKNLKLMKKAEFNRISFEDITVSPGRYLRGGVDFNSIELSISKKQDIQEQPSLEPEQIIKGEAVSPGYFAGRARVIEYIDNSSKLEPNEVIITRCIDPGQTHVFMLAGALVFEVGGMLSHGAILAREFNLPTVAHVKDATRIFETGQKISVNGTKGIVIVDSKNNRG